MNPTPEDQIPFLAVLYDRFARAIDPLSDQTDQAERQFVEELARLYDELPSENKPSFRDFRRGVIERCIRHLRATDKPASV